MAKPIKNTPILKGKDAVAFFENLEKNKQKKVDIDYLLAIRNNAKEFQNILKVK
jgi:hypothetical protein